MRGGQGGATPNAVTAHVCFSHWDVGQPDDWDAQVNGEDCGQLHGRITVERRRLWNDGDCTLYLPFICEGKPKSH